MACFSWRPQGVKSAGLFLTTALLLAGLGGCSDESTRNIIDTAAQKSTQGLKDAANPPLPNKKYNPLVVSDRVWAGTTAVRMHRGIPLPDKYESAHGIALVSSKPLAMADIAAAITEQTGIPVFLADAAGGGQPGAADGGSVGGGFPLAYEGPLSGLLERTAATYGVSWRFDGSSITIRRFETRTFVIESLPGSQDVQEGMQDDTSSGSSGGSSGGGSSTSTITQNSKTSISFKYWDELGQILTSMLGGTGSLVVSPSVGSVTVTTTPEVMRSVAEYLAKENQRLSRQIAVTIEVYSVDLSEGMDFNVAFSTALKSLTNIKGNITSGAKAPAEASGAFSGLSASNGGIFNLAILNPKTTGQISDVFTALSAIGDTTKVAKFPLITLNDHPVARRIGTDISYLASASSTSGSTTGALPTVTLTPGTVHQGFSVQLTPRLLDDGRILLQYSLSITDLLKLSCFSSTGFDCSGNSSSSAASGTGSAIQAPTTSNRIFVQQSVLKSGSTLIIGGAEQETTQQNSQGVGDPFNYIFGGGSSNGRAHTMVFFALTPQVLDVPHSEQE